ncbi:hypothetical protein [Janthinobacterium agaricidamnosum]|uniref:Uncharacterized protein n=1 Tax=Janthinobacterium agaricidamnosum NBRC 102515 = DSM 9628 TaxID=1349767 RepID=W0VC83_9BURK|nr:hypothetical protein [Janthinobacterium agaricidamnosum]CDG84948.1 hypothetical protein GJA_4340 [Janthinobacterium agaricidamnosum NBRC 102515 = DSM 9628]
MSCDLIATISSALAAYGSATRLYVLALDHGAADGLLIEAFDDGQVHPISSRDLISSCRSRPGSHRPPCPARLHVGLADDSRFDKVGASGQSK